LSTEAVPPELAAPDSPVGTVVPVAAPPAPARAETGAESPAPAAEEVGSACVDEAVAAAAAAAAAAASGDALPSAGKEAPPDTAA
jgi:hypothetical protein